MVPTRPWQDHEAGVPMMRELPVVQEVGIVCEKNAVVSVSATQDILVRPAGEIDF
jgi:hypothetical protein